MALTKLVTDLENIQALSDTPNATEGLTADELKAKFDKAPTDIKTYLNDTLTAELDTSLGLKLLASSKAVGSDVTTGTEDTKYVTAKAIADAGLNTRLKSKIITATRDGAGENGDVSYTGVGFVPTSIRAIMSRDGSLFNSDGFADSTKASYCIANSAANVNYAIGKLVSYTNAFWGQEAVVKSFDADGFTLTWTKTSTPDAGTLQLRFICYR